MANGDDAEIPQILGRQAPENLEVDIVLAERRLVLFEAELPQPASDIHARLHSG
jgi:hypothetical protein